MTASDLSAASCSRICCHTNALTVVNSDQRLHTVKLKLISSNLEIWSLDKAMSGGYSIFFYLLRKPSIKIKKIVRIVDKSPWGTIIILRIICVLLLNYEKAMLSF